MKRLIPAIILALALAAPVMAAKSAPTTCVVDGTSVTATGLPTDELIYFFFTTDTVKQGQAIGFTDTGSFTVEVFPRDGETTYEFARAQGNHYVVLSTCAAS